MKSLNIHNPIFITGRGGSGTRLLSRLLNEIDIYLGSRLNKQGDSMEWVALNREMLKKEIRIENGNFNNYWKRKLQDLAKSELLKAPEHLFTHWGAKLPEFMMFVPELMAAFPQAKIVHLTRHPVNLSLRRTHVSSRLGNTVGDIVLPKAYNYLGWEVNINEQKECINNAVSWQYQVSKLLDFSKNNLNKYNYMVVRFEDLVINQQKVLNDICNFLNIPANKKAQIKIDLNRANIDSVHSNDADEVWEICRSSALSLGYRKHKYD